MVMEMADAAMKEAERSCKTGADKKAWVMSMIKSTCKTMKIEFDENDITL